MEEQMDMPFQFEQREITFLSRKCSKCGEVKSLEDFYKQKECKDGRTGWCKLCHYKYVQRWKKRNRLKVNKRRKELYAQHYGPIQREKERIRKEQYPLRVRGQVLRSGMKERARQKGLEFDSDYFTVAYLMKRLSDEPFCECCKRKLDIGFKSDRKFNDNSPSIDRVDSTRGYTKDNVAILCWRCNKHKQDASSEELRQIADWMDSWQTTRIQES